MKIKWSDFNFWNLEKFACIVLGQRLISFSLYFELFRLVNDIFIYIRGCRAKLKLPYLCWLFVFTFSSCPLLELVCAQNSLLIEVTELLGWWNYKKEKLAPQCLFIISVIVWCFHCVKWSSVCFSFEMQSCNVSDILFLWKLFFTLHIHVPIEVFRLYICYA